MLQRKKRSPGSKAGGEKEKSKTRAVMMMRARKPAAFSRSSMIWRLGLLRQVASFFCYPKIQTHMPSGSSHATSPVCGFAKYHRPELASGTFSQPDSCPSSVKQGMAFSSDILRMCKGLC